MYKGIAPGVLIVLAMVYGWWLATPDVQPPNWAEITELHAIWDDRQQVLRISMVFDKRVECDSITVSKHLSPMRGDKVVVETNPIPMDGELWKKLQSRPVGIHEVFDDARVVGHARLPYGTYQLSIVATCNREDIDPNEIPASLLTTTPVLKQVLISRRLLDNKKSELEFDLAMSGPRLA